MDVLKEFIQLCLESKYDKAWKEVLGDDDVDHVPVWKHFPKVAYHGTSLTNAQQMLNGFQPAGWANNIDLAFDRSVAEGYGGFAHGDFVVLEFDVTKLDKKHIYMNYDIGSDGFSYDGFVPKGAVKMLKPKRPSK